MSKGKQGGAKDGTKGNKVPNDQRPVTPRRPPTSESMKVNIGSSPSQPSPSNIEGHHRQRSVTEQLPELTEDEESGQSESSSLFLNMGDGLDDTRVRRHQERGGNSGNHPSIDDKQNAEHDSKQPNE